MRRDLREALVSVQVQDRERTQLNDRENGEKRCNTLLHCPLVWRRVNVLVREWGRRTRGDSA